VTVISEGLESKISVVIVTFNCAEFIEECIKSALWADEIVVVDVGSTDETLTICKKYPLRIEMHSWVPRATLIREEIMTLASFDWVLELDPDERVTPGLANHLRNLISSPKMQSIGCVEIPWQNIVFGKWVKHGDWWPDRHGRFGRKGRIFYPSAIHHSGQSVDSETIYLDADPDLAIIHYAIPSMQKVYERMIRYAKDHAREYFEKGQHFSYYKLIIEPLYAFLYSYIRKKGFLDGRAGFVYSFIWKFLYNAVIILDIWELEGYPLNNSKNQKNQRDTVDDWKT
jgi:(heptosyl)LPS beta-1,4-glucosyltransferase